MTTTTLERHQERAFSGLERSITPTRETSISISIRNTIARLEGQPPKNYTIRAIARLAHCSEPGIYRSPVALSECKAFLKRNQQRILALLKQGLTASEIVKRTGVSHPTLRKWRRNA